MGTKPALQPCPSALQGQWNAPLPAGRFVPLLSLSGTECSGNLAVPARLTSFPHLEKCKVNSTLRACEEEYTDTGAVPADAAAVPMPAPETGRHPHGGLASLRLRPSLAQCPRDYPSSLNPVPAGGKLREQKIVLTLERFWGQVNEAYGKYSSKVSAAIAEQPNFLHEIPVPYLGKRGRLAASKILLGAGSSVARGSLCEESSASPTALAFCSRSGMLRLLTPEVRSFVLGRSF